jgi:hypothetical protein
MNFGNIGLLVADQMSAIENDYKGREDDFEYMGSISIVMYCDKGDDTMRVRARTSTCHTCSLKALHLATEQFLMGLACLSEEGE